MAASPYVPDFGRIVEGHKVLVRPGLDIPDLPGPTTISILVCPHSDIQGITQVFTPKDHHWMLLWGPVKLEGRYYRVIQATREWDPRANPTIASTARRLDFLTNPGPKTLSLTTKTEEHGKFVPVGVLSPEARMVLERIAKNHPVHVPDGAWNCQDFVAEILGKAVDQGLFDRTAVDDALKVAEKGLSEKRG
ncbi:hypothetical protein OE88DRAFT_1732724 [Heliocybe sulcata]|uniref:Uncharacterized protein n=1 Tax=Heliocybe sulcata TaxID=5364 RepID=A0A5C3NDB8_9AGAM|nr:hypothetical protein OE88DRAFT_1732724 [Heliocybe sulcata]